MVDPILMAQVQQLSEPDLLELRRAIDGLARVLAIEIVTGCRALDLRAPLKPAPATAAVRDAVRRAGVAGPGPDRYVSPDLEAVTELVLTGEIARAAASLTDDTEGGRP